MPLLKRLRSRLSRPPAESCIGPNDHVIFFPTAASQNPDGTWHVPIHGWIFRPTDVSRLRRAALRLSRFLARRRIPNDGIAESLFNERAGSFLADNTRGNCVQIILNNTIHTLKRSKPNGHFRSHIDVVLPPSARQIPFRAHTRDGDTRLFQGTIRCLPPAGLSVISDIDDTIKITHVLSRRAMLRNTFLKDFACVPDMATLYRHWQQQHDAAFHYISASPWHLYPFLSEFLAAHDFPAGTFHLREFRLVPGDLRRTLRPGRRTKLKHARELLRRFPQRRFILVGDSGESDLAIYARLARQFPSQIEKIYIRDVQNLDTHARRWKKMCVTLPAGLCKLFQSPNEIVD